MIGQIGKIPASHIRMHGFEYKLFLVPAFCYWECWEVQARAQIIEHLLPVWKSQIELPIPGLGLAQPKLLQMLGKWTSKEKSCVCVCVSVCSCSQINAQII